MTVISMTTYQNNIISDENIISKKILDLSVPCPYVTVLPSANIFAMDILITPTQCREPCTINVDVTYINGGNAQGWFEPKITIDGLPTSLPFAILDPGLTIIKTFSVTNLSRGSHIICTEPIGITTCQTIYVQPPVTSAALPIWLGVGLLFGHIIQKAKKCEDYKTRAGCRENDCDWKDKKCVPFSKHDKFLIGKLKEKGAKGIPTCSDGEKVSQHRSCTIAPWTAITRKGREPIMIHDP